MTALVSGECPEPTHPHPHISRRRFFFFGAAAGLTLAAVPVQLLAPEPAVPFERIYLPTKHLMARIRISGPMIQASRGQTGGFLRAALAEERQALAALTRDFERRLQSSADFPLDQAAAGPYPADTMALHDEEHRIDAADWGDQPASSAVDEKLWRAQTMGSFETPQQPLATQRRDRRVGGDWSGPGRRASDPEIARFADDGGPV